MCVCACACASACACACACARVRACVRACVIKSSKRSPGTDIATEYMKENIRAIFVDMAANIRIRIEYSSHLNWCINTQLIHFTSFSLVGFR